MLNRIRSGCRHLTAIRAADRLRLYVNGQQVATSAKFKAEDFNISNDQPLRIGFGAHDYFNGKLKDVHLYARALTQREIAKLADGKGAGR